VFDQLEKMMTFWKPALLILGLSASAVSAQDISDEAMAALATRVDAFSTSVAGGDMGAVFDYMPPLVLSSLAAQSGLDEAALIEASKSAIAEAMKTVTIDSFEMDVEGATEHATPDGSINYALIPTSTIMTIEGAGGMKATGDTLAFEQDGKWYLARVDDPSQAALLQAAYPAFVGVTFAPGEMTPVE
jgi:hypothetical protein